MSRSLICGGCETFYSILAVGQAVAPRPPTPCSPGQVLPSLGASQALPMGIVVPEHPSSGPAGGGASIQGASQSAPVPYVASGDMLSLLSTLPIERMAARKLDSPCRARSLARWRRAVPGQTRPGSHAAPVKPINFKKNI